jgi:hypothetical protein
MRKNLFVLFAVLVLAFTVFAADTLIYEANFDKTDSKKVSWEPVIGEWEIVKGAMSNYDMSNWNTNIYQDVDQIGEGVFIYEYKVTYDDEGGGNAPAAGLHFMATDGEADNRGDSYLVFQDNIELQLYKCVSGGIMAVQRIPGFGAVVGKSYVVRIEYTTKTGNVKIFLDNELVIDWKDVEPLVDGSVISFRTNTTEASYDYVKIWYRK